MRVAILVLSVDEAELLRASLPLAAAQDAALWVIDNACDDDTQDVARAAGARVVALPRRETYAAAMNAGLAPVLGAGEADAVLLLNADCFLHPGFLRAAVPALARAPRAGSLAPKLVRTAGPPPDPAAPPLPSEAIDAAGMTIDRRRKNSLVGHGRSALLYAEPAEVFGADGACALYRAQTLRDVAIGEEVLDEDMALWASDADLAWRARARGWRSIYEPRALARHVRTYSPSTRRATSPAHRRLQFRNRLLMVAKNETAAGLRSDGARIAAYELAALGYALAREPRALLPGYVEAVRLLPGAHRRRVKATTPPPFGLAPPP